MKQIITVEDKLKVFSENIIKNVEKESEERIAEFSLKNRQSLEREQQSILREAADIINRAKKSAQDEKSQIVSKANMEKEYELLTKKKEIFERVMNDIKKRADLYTKTPEYINFLEKSLEKGLSNIDSKEVIIYVKTDDIKKYQDKIQIIVNKNRADYTSIRIEPSDEDILGGCIAVNGENTLRVDCSMKGLIDSNMEVIGGTLSDSL